MFMLNVDKCLHCYTSDQAWYSASVELGTYSCTKPWANSQKSRHERSIDGFPIPGPPTSRPRAVEPLRLYKDGQHTALAKRRKKSSSESRRLSPDVTGHELLYNQLLLRTTDGGQRSPSPLINTKMGYYQVPTCFFPVASIPLSTWRGVVEVMPHIPRGFPVPVTMRY